MCKKIAAILATLSLILTLQACSGDDRQTSAETTATTAASQQITESTAAPTPTPTPAVSGVGDFVLPVAGQRPVAVMIDNEGTRSLPQGGMYLAQVVYEIIVEGGETRLMPVFWGTAPELIGPVRSSRHYFLDYVLENDAIYVHFGWSPQAQRDIPKLKINNINGVANGGEIFWDLTKERNNWQDSYTSMKKIMEYANKVKYRTTTEKKAVFNFASMDTVAAEGTTATKVTLKFTSAITSSFEYDSSTGLYNRFRKGKPHMERNTGKQLTAKNILVQITPNNGIKGDDKGRQEVSTTGSGKGFLISNGKSVPIKWSKASRSEATKYQYENGSEINLNPGQTWVEIFPAAGKLTVE